MQVATRSRGRSAGWAPWRHVPRGICRRSRGAQF